MFLYIVRHGIAFDRSEWHGSDDTRPLTDEGQEKTRAVFEGLHQRKMLDAEALWSSPLVRAKQTAEIMGSVLHLPVTTMDELVQAALEELQARMKKMDAEPKRLVLVGHEPGCGCLIADLAGEPDKDYSLKKAGLAFLQGDFKPGGMKVLWRLAPKDVL